MKKLCIFLFLLATVSLAVAQSTAPDQPMETLQFNFRGKWLPSVDPAHIGPENYRVLQNLRYTSLGGLESVGGYTKINTTVVSGTPEIDDGIHFKKDNPAETHVIISADDTVYQNTTAIPNAGDFSGTSLHTAAAGAGDPRLSIAPFGHVAYANGVESMLWAGDEMPNAAFITSTAAITNTVTNPRDYTVAVNNDLADGGNIAVIGGGNDPNTLLLVHLDGADGATSYTSDDTNAHTVGFNGNAELSTDQKKFGVSSAEFDGTGDFLSVTDDHGVTDSWHMAALKFAIEGRFRFTTVAGSIGLWQQWDDGDNQVYLRYTANFLHFAVYDATVQTITLSRAWTPVINTWYHIAVIRGWNGNQNDWALTVNGSILGVVLTDVSEWPDLAADFQIGADSSGGFTGWIDEFRATKGETPWASDYTPPSRPYSAPARYFLIGSARPLSGFKAYVADGNTKTSEMTVKEWNGSSWTELTITDNTDTGATLAQTGTVTWDSTVSTSKVKFIESRLFYWYQANIDAGNATIYRITLNAPWQDIVDIWDGVPRQPIQFQAFKSSKFEDYTLEVNDQDATFYGDLGGMTAAEHLIVMFDDRTTATDWTMVAGKENVTAATVTVFFWNGDAWQSVGDVSDTTLDDDSGTKSLGQTGNISWNPPSRASEFSQTLFGTNGYAYKFVWSATLTASNAQVNTLTGVPAQLTVPPFKFPALYKDRLFLCGYIKGGQGNRCDFSQTHSPQIFNGAESSNSFAADGQPNTLFFGGEEEVTAAVELYNRVGSNIFDFLVVLKEHEIYVVFGDGPTFSYSRVSGNIGCPAPKTLITAEVGFNISKDVERNIAAWLSYTGPIIFDGVLPIRVPGLEIFFDPNSADYVGQSVIQNAVGWFDQIFGEYNLIVGTNWFVYNFRQQKWFTKSVGTADLPISAWTVRDTSGNQYVYAGLDNGFMMRLENGTSWDGTGIAQRVQTGDFWPTKSVWDVTVLRRIKLAVKRIANPNGLDVIHYGDGDERAVSNFFWKNTSIWRWKNTSVWRWDNGTSVLAMNLSGLDTTNRSRVIRMTEEVDLIGESHGLRFETTTDDNDKGFQPIYWAVEFMRRRKDH